MNNHDHFWIYLIGSTFFLHNQKLHYEIIIIAYSKSNSFSVWYGTQSNNVIHLRKCRKTWGRWTVTDFRLNGK
jgi:hypothetical protein